MRIRRLVYLNTFSLSCTYCTAAQRGDKKDCITMVTAHHSTFSCLLKFLKVITDRKKDGLERCEMTV